MANVSKEDVIEFISNISVLELSELVKELEDKFGVSAAAPVAMMAAGAGGEAERCVEVADLRHSLPGYRSELPRSPDDVPLRVDDQQGVRTEQRAVRHAAVGVSLDLCRGSDSRRLPRRPLFGSDRLRLGRRTVVGGGGRGLLGAQCAGVGVDAGRPRGR